MSAPSTISENEIYQWLSEIPDPEIPVISIIELGILRKVTIENDGSIKVTITPTYSGCPAMDIISMQIRMGLLSRGISKVTIEHQLSPAWTSDWIPDSAKQKMLDYGIVPPSRKSTDALGLFEEDRIPCPRCSSKHTELTSQFGSTSCKALYRCLDCHEPFEHFKCH